MFRFWAFFHEREPTLTRLHGKLSPRLTGLPYLADRATRLGGSPHLSCKRDQDKIRNYMDRRVTPPRRVTSPTWGPPPPCKQALISLALMHHLINVVFFVALLPGNVTEHERNEKQRGKKWSLPISHMHIRSVIPAKKKAIIFMEKVFDLTGRSIWKSKRRMARLVKSKW